MLIKFRLELILLLSSIACRSNSAADGQCDCTSSVCIHTLYVCLRNAQIIILFSYYLIKLYLCLKEKIKDSVQNYAFPRRIALNMLPLGEKSLDWVAKKSNVEILALAIAL